MLDAFGLAIPAHPFHQIDLKADLVLSCDMYTIVLSACNLGEENTLLISDFSRKYDNTELP